MNNWREKTPHEKLYAIGNDDVSLWSRKSFHFITEKGDIQASTGANDARSAFDLKEREQILADIDRQEKYLLKSLEETREARRVFLANPANEPEKKPR